jgi:predicted TIM-barrel fold metal-dependent hydrolase
MIKLIKYTPSERLFFGSDFPFGNPLIQFENLNEIMDSINLNSEKTEGVFTRNWLNFVFN